MNQKQINQAFLDLIQELYFELRKVTPSHMWSSIRPFDELAAVLKAEIEKK